MIGNNSAFSRKLLCPNICARCGATPADNKYSASNQAGKVLAALEVPICASCENDLKKVPKVRNNLLNILGSIFALLAAVIFFIFIFLSSAEIFQTMETCLVGFLIVIGVLGMVYVLTWRIVWKTALRQAGVRFIDTSEFVWYANGWQFRNKEFGDEMSRLNGIIF
jgi:hypothetical protein